MANRGTVLILATPQLVGIATYGGPSAAVHHANFDNAADIIRYADPPEVEPPKTTGQLWPRGDQ